MVRIKAISKDLFLVKVFSRRLKKLMKNSPSMVLDMLDVHIIGGGI